MSSSTKGNDLPIFYTDEGIYTDSKVLVLQKRVQECVMSIGTAMTDQVCAAAALEQEKVKLQTISAKKGVLGADHSPLRRDAATQTDGSEVLVEKQQLLERQSQLLREIKGMPKNSASMVDILKKRNAALLTREERALQRARNLRQEKMDRLDQLKRHKVPSTGTHSPLPP